MVAQIDVHGMLVEEALETVEHHLCGCGGLAADLPEGIVLSIIVGEHPAHVPTAQ